MRAILLPNGDTRSEITSYYNGIPGFLPSHREAHALPDGSTWYRDFNNNYTQLAVNDPSGAFLYFYYQFTGVTSPYNTTTITYPNGNLEMDLEKADFNTDIYYYNTRHQLVGIKRANGLTTTNIYGSDGFLKKSIDIESQATNSYTFANGLPSSVTTPLGLTLNYSWDNLCRLTQISFPDGTTISNNYNRLDVVDHKDRLNHWTHAAYDNMQQLSSSTDANGYTTYYDYCSCGALASITDPLNNWTSFTRDYDGNVTAVTNSDGFSIAYNRNILGQVTSLATSANLNLNYAYSDYGLKTQCFKFVGHLVFSRL